MPGFHRHLCKVAYAFPLPLQLCMCIPSTSAFTHNCGAAVVTTPFITGSSYRRMSSVHETRRDVWHSWLHKSAHSVSRSLPERRRGGLHFRGCVALWKARRQHPEQISSSISGLKYLKKPTLGEQISSPFADDAVGYRQL